MSDRRPFDRGPLADPGERQVIFATLDSFRQYRRNVHYNVTHRRRQNLYALPKHQWQILAAPPFSLLDVLTNVDDALDCNADIADAILELGLLSFDLPAEPEKGSLQDWHGTAKPGDIAKAHSTVRQFYRDWSEEGFKAEVEPIYRLVLDDLAFVLKVPKCGYANPTLLMPGAGLGRLLFSLSLQGYSVEGNEISYHQLLASNFVLNATHRAREYKLYPFVSTFTNHKSRADQLKAVLVPDVHPATTLQEQKSKAQLEHFNIGDMNMTAGDFLTSYGDPDSRNSFDAVVSVYFIDTAPNLIRYIETVRNCLKDGGVWINVGPLLWHFDDRRIGSPEDTKGVQSDEANIVKRSLESEELSLSFDTGIAEPGSFELVDEEVLSLLKTMRFEIVRHEYMSTKCGGYIQDSESMIQNRYACSHWVARKLPDLAGLI